MIKLFKRRKNSDNSYIALIVCIVVLIIGYITLNHISMLEDPPLGNTFYIFLGSTLLCVGLLGIIVIIKHLRDVERKKRKQEYLRKKHKIVFLKDTQIKSENKS